jgi:hypothetical protein
MGDSESKQFGDQYLGKLGNQLDKKAPVFGQSLFAGAGDATRNAWNQGTDFATRVNNSSGYNPAMGDARNVFGSGVAEYGKMQGNGGLSQAGSDAMYGVGRLGEGYAGLYDAYDPNSAAYKTLRQGVVDDTLSNLGSQFTASGRFGGGSYIGTASQGLGDALAGLDYNNMSKNIDNQYRSLDSQRGTLGDMFGMAQTGTQNQFNALGGQQAAGSSLFNAGQTALANQQGAIDSLGQIGAAQDANAQGALLGQADLFDRTKNAGLDRLIKIGAAFGDPVGAANEAPWWQQLLGGAIGLGGSAISGGAFGGK